MSDCLDYYSEDGTAETQRFVRKFDSFFDMMNTRCLEEGCYNKKPDLKAYRKLNDTHFEVYNSKRSLICNKFVVAKVRIVGLLG